MTQRSTPLVSCVLPTANRRRFVAQAIRYFQAQDYPERELLVMDDGDDAVEDLVPDDPRIRYVRAPKGRTLGAKRNDCVEQSRGDLILHWDDDDWMAPHRIRYQVGALLARSAEVCGLSQMLFFDPAARQTWLYDYPDQDRPWIAGGSLLYTKAFWRRAPFPDVQVASDTTFVWSQSLERAAIVPDYRFYVAIIHSRNTSPKHTDMDYWTPWTANVAALMGEDYAFYEQLATDARPRDAGRSLPRDVREAVLRERDARGGGTR